MAKQSAVMYAANKMAQKIIAEQTRARQTLCFDAAIMAAHAALQMGPGRSAPFALEYGNALDKLAELYVSDATDNKDEKLVYAKDQRDKLIRSIVGDDNFVPFDLAYGDVYMDELKRIRAMPYKPWEYERSAATWEKTEQPGFCRCSACRNCYIEEEWVTAYKWAFCPSCGAKMRKAGEGK